MTTCLTHLSEECLQVLLTIVVLDVGHIHCSPAVAMRTLGGRMREETKGGSEGGSEGGRERGRGGRERGRKGEREKGREERKGKMEDLNRLSINNYCFARCMKNSKNQSSGPAHLGLIPSSSSSPSSLLSEG